VDEERARRLLEAERDRLSGLLGAAERTTQGDLETSQGELSHVDQHPADEATELFEQERDLGLGQDLRRQLAEVEAAVERVEQGTFGICEVCGRPIGDERLEAMPAARLCLEDQERAERGLAPR
jgi:RNA polymerase-binding transcription factor DksA